MTLSVSPYIRDEEGNLEWLEMPSGFNELVGTEVTRKTFWGSDRLKSLGLNILPSLISTDIFAEKNELGVLENEIDHLISNLSSMYKGEEFNYWNFRLSNIKEAIGVAKEKNGGVCIQ